jgi:uncharacterized protein YjbI with pentapeptide repeats
MKQWRVAIVALVLLSVSFGPWAQGKEWTWTDLSGNTRTQANLDEILKEQKVWVESNHSRGKFADLGFADLVGAHLHGANLELAHLNGADLG